MYSIISPCADIHNLNKTIVHFQKIIIQLVEITRYNYATIRVFSDNRIYTCNDMFTHFQVIGLLRVIYTWYKNARYCSR